MYSKFISLQGSRFGQRRAERGRGSGEAIGEQRGRGGQVEEHSHLFLLNCLDCWPQTGNQDLLCHTQDLSVLPTVYIHAGMHPMVSSTWRFGRQEWWGGEEFTLHIHHQHHWQLRNGNNTDNSHTINILSDALLFFFKQKVLILLWKHNFNGNVTLF